MGNTIFDPELYRRAQEETRELLKNRVAPPGLTTNQKTKVTPSPVTINVGTGTGPFNISDPYVSGKPRQDPLFYLRERQTEPPVLSAMPPPAPGTPPGWLERQRLMSQWAIPTTGGLPTEKVMMRDMMRDYPPVLARGGGSMPPVLESMPPVLAKGGVEPPIGAGPEEGVFYQYTGRGGELAFTDRPGVIPPGTDFQKRRWADVGHLPQAGQFPIPPARELGQAVQFPAREISTYQTGWSPAMVGGRQVMLPSFTHGIEGAPNTGTRAEWASYMGRQRGEPSQEEEMMRLAMNVIRSPYGYTPSQRSAAAEIFGDITRNRIERERLARGAYEFEKMFPLRREELGIRQGEADTHRFVAEQAAKHQEEIGKHITVPSGTTVIDRATGKPIYQASFAPERAAGIIQYAIAAATEEGLTGKTVNPMTFVGMMNMMGSRLGEGYKPITMKEVPKEWVSPYIENRIKRIKPNLKAESDEYKKLYEVYEKALYMTGQ